MTACPTSDIRGAWLCKFTKSKPSCSLWACSAANCSATLMRWFTPCLLRDQIHGWHLHLRPVPQPSIEAVQAKPRAAQRRAGLKLAGATEPWPRHAICAEPRGKRVTQPGRFLPTRCMHTTSAKPQLSFVLCSCNTSKSGAVLSCPTWGCNMQPCSYSSCAQACRSRIHAIGFSLPNPWSERPVPEGKQPTGMLP